MNKIKVSINRNAILSKKITFKIDFNKHVHNIDLGIHNSKLGIKTG